MYNITIVTIGPYSYEDITLRAVSCLKSDKEIILRTSKHGISKWLEDNNIASKSLDYLYEEHEDFDELNLCIAKKVLESAQKRNVAYCVSNPSSDETVNKLFELADETYDIEVIAGVSCEALCQSKIHKNNRENGICVITANNINNIYINPNISYMITEINSRLVASDIKLCFSKYLEDEMTVEYFIYNKDGYKKTSIELFKLDMMEIYDHTSVVYIQGSKWEGRNKYNFDDLLNIMKRLRAPGGCPWDRKQDHISLRPYMLEEAYEAVEAISEEDTEHMCEELGDVMFQVVFHAEIASAKGNFDIADITSSVCNKMIERHPHVFENNKKLKDAQDVVINWESFKRKQRGIKSNSEAMKDVSKALGSLIRAKKIQQKAVKAGIDNNDISIIINKLKNNINLIEKNMVSQNSNDNIEKILGEILFDNVGLCRLLDHDSEVLLDEFTEKYINIVENEENISKND